MNRTGRYISSTLFLAFVCGSMSYAQSVVADKYDVVIRSGKIIDGSGAPWYRADVGIRDGKIAAIGTLDSSQAAEEIDAAGLIVAPGFVDMMGQTATPMLEQPHTALNLLKQGVTTINAGEGSSAAPLGAEEASRLGWSTMSEYFQLLDLKGLPVNVVQTVGHTQIRQIVLGELDRRPLTDELVRMQEYVREAMQAGAIGVSTALIYPPAVYADTKEIAALASVAGESGGRYYTHMRNEGDQLLEAIDEALQIGEQAGTPVHIYHLKAAGESNWGKMPLAIATIQQARAKGQQVTADIYPYEYNGLGLEALIHPRHFVDGRGKLLRRLSDSELRAEIREEIESTDGWENWYRHAGEDWDRIIIGNSTSEKYGKWHGKSIADIAAAADEDPWDTFFNLVQANAFALPETMSKANIVKAMQEEFISFCTDVGPASESRSVSHPRSHGAFPRLFSQYVRNLGCISLERAVAQASAVAANDVAAYDRGRLAIGLAADIVVFDYDKFTDTATPAEPRSMPKGMLHVIVNGNIALKNGRLTNHRPGRVLRGPGFETESAAHNIISGQRATGLGEIDRLMQDYMKENRAPGASLAITENGRLVYARGFGYADVATREVIQPESLFRIASVSKPITAVAILQLVDEGKLELDTEVFSILDDYEPHLGPNASLDERQQSITIRHLLEHRGGWDRDRSFDGMFQSVRFAKAMGAPSPAGHDEIIRCMLGLPLDFTPGERYAYSNYGYCLLGRVIERLTGQTYEEYVKDHVLAPVGVESMAIGATHLKGRRKDEVRYYDSGVTYSVFEDDLHQRVPSPYGAWYLESMDSHGAWIASATDLVRFASAFDEPADCPLLKEQTVSLMWRRPPGAAGYGEDGAAQMKYYGLGWQMTTDEQGEIALQMHGGSLPGTSTKLVRRSDGRNFALLFNARQSSRELRLAEGILPKLHALLDRIEIDENTDLFEESP